MKRTIKDFELWGKRVIIRCDFNVPIENGKIVDDNRLVEATKTIKYAMAKNGRIVLMSHLGRIKTEEDKVKYSLKIVAQQLSKLLKKEVIFITNTRGKELEEAIFNLKNKDILLIENTRFEDFPNNLESNNDKLLAKYWANLGDIFINDAFGTIHRSHASNVGIANYLPNGIGFLVEQELKIFNEIITKPKLPFVVVLGGAKIKDKIGVIKNLVRMVDYILIGGGMAFTFLKAQQLEIGNSIIDEDNILFCQEILKQYSDKIILPIDVVCKDGSTKLVTNLNYDDVGLDIGLETISLFINYLTKSKTVFWNGPVGLFENELFIKGTKELAEFLVEKPIKVIIGGGDTVNAIKKLKLNKAFSHISTGGGASLELISGNELPAIKVINNR